MVRVAIALLILLLVPSVALAEKRIALLIGNQAYGSQIGALANPHNDVALLEKTLKALSFEVAVERDASLGALTRAVNAYARRLRAAGPDAIGFFYYSGHGAADGTINYLIPVDAKSAEDSELWDQSLRLTEITRKLKGEAGNATHFVVFDACRNSLKLKQTGSRALVQSKGFVPVSQESGMLIAYATAEGELASDRGSVAGPYATVLAEEIVKPGYEAVTMFRRVQVRVRSAIGQEPWLGFSALGEVHLAGVQVEPPKIATPVRLSEAAEAWAAVKDVKNVAAVEAFVARFNDTFYADLARLRIKELSKQDDPVEAQRAIDAAHTLLEAGKSEQAAKALTTVLEGGNLPPAIMAKALLYRGIAYRHQKQPSQAIADLTSALWLKGGLGEADRSDAMKQRSSAYQEAGLADSGGLIANSETQQTPPGPGGAGFVAVLSTRKTRMDALKTLADMQEKYGEVLSSRTPDVQEANLGEKGVWYRLIVGPPGSRDAAASLCTQLKTAGFAGCWVTSY